MKRHCLLPAVLLAALPLAACTGTSGAVRSSEPAAALSAGAMPDLPSPAKAAPVHVKEGQDLGNGRPEVSYDGLMVRRRVVIAAHSDINADLRALNEKLSAAAAARNIAVDAIPATVLQPAVLQHVMPELIVALPASASLEDGQAVVDQAVRKQTDARAPEHFHVLPVLVHDLKFTITTANPAELSAAVNREGILSDALGNYDTAVDSDQVTFSYTGPLLADATVENVRSGIARQAHKAAAAVVVGPRSVAGTGVDMDTEPQWDPEVTEEKPGHSHG